MARKSVPTAEVRAWGRDNLNVSDHPCLGEGARGRLSPEVVKAFKAANPNRTYAEKAAEVGTVTVKVPTTNSKGVLSRRSQEIPAPEAREIARLAGLSSEQSRGALSADALDHIGAALARL